MKCHHAGCKEEAVMIEATGWIKERETARC